VGRALGILAGLLPVARLLVDAVQLGRDVRAGREAAGRGDGPPADRPAEPAAPDVAPPAGRG
jgi:hypothetical protein